MPKVLRTRVTVIPLGRIRSFVCPPCGVVMLDRDLPGTHGDEICRALAAERSPSRVLMLTAASSVKDRVEGLGLGADDYLPKPFDFSEMVARVQALGRRPGAPKPEHLGYRDLTVDPEKRLADRAGRRLALSPKEFAVLECLLVADGRPVSAEELLERVWDEATDPLFLLFGGVLVAITYLLFEGATTFRTPPIPKVPNAAPIENLKLPSPMAKTLPKELYQAQQQLAEAQNQLGTLPSSPSAGSVRNA